MNHPVHMMYTPEELAELLNVNRRTILVWIREGKLSAKKISRNLIRIPAEAVDEMLAKVNQ